VKSEQAYRDEFMGSKRDKEYFYDFKKPSLIKNLQVHHTNTLHEKKLGRIKKIPLTYIVKDNI
jgi:hypothetical protein